MYMPNADIRARLEATVDPEAGAIPMFVYTDPDVYRLELENLFGRTWLYVAHESELPEAGSFVVRRMGEQSVIVGRGDDETVRVFLNSCRHRGMRLANEDFGCTEMWRCPYHGFTYGSKGEFLGTLIGAPYERQAYPEGLDKEALHLIEARVESYRGMIFATWNLDGPSLDEFLGNVRWYLDIVLGRAEMEVVGVPQKWIVPSGWKLPSENFCADAYHTATAHSFLARLKLVEGVDFGRDGYHVDPGGGHGLGIGVHDPAEGSYFPDSLEAEYARNLDAEQLGLLHRVKNFHGNVFPNLSFLIPNFIPMGDQLVSGMMLRLWQPIGPDKLEVWSWHLVERDAPAQWKRLARKMYVQTFGVSGMFDQDDTENWEAQTLNSNTALTRPDEVMLHYAMGISAAPLDDFPGPGAAYDGKFSEAAGRTFYRTWLDALLARGAA
ncbi:MAG: aromatic ring-hydroxylating dioxygenase subunit alpha [Actinobacteria bacterium]|nr:aromatic ring-hydroxylating dioxygenase subunit alpha [Actinomycetota bacterium]